MAFMSYAYTNRNCWVAMKRRTLQFPVTSCCVGKMDLFFSLPGAHCNKEITHLCTLYNDDIHGWLAAKRGGYQREG